MFRKVLFAFSEKKEAAQGIDRYEQERHDLWIFPKKFLVRCHKVLGSSLLVDLAKINIGIGAHQVTRSDNKDQKGKSVEVLGTFTFDKSPYTVAGPRKELFQCIEKALVKVKHTMHKIMLDEVLDGVTVNGCFLPTIGAIGPGKLISTIQALMVFFVFHFKDFWI